MVTGGTIPHITLNDLFLHVSFLNQHFHFCQGFSLFISKYYFSSEFLLASKWGKTLIPIVFSILYSLTVYCLSYFIWSHHLLHFLCYMISPFIVFPLLLDLTIYCFSFSTRSHDLLFFLFYMISLFIVFLMLYNLIIYSLSSSM